jgi:low affinity Fe/Cu permease
MSDVSPEPSRLRTYLSAAARAVVAAAGSTASATIAVVLVAMWTAVGIVAGFSQRWLDLLLATSGAVTFVMVFLIQHTTGVQTRAVLLKLDELVRADERARDDVIAAEHLPLHEQERLEDRVAGNKAK